jgi:hypothetical protein
MHRHCICQAPANLYAECYAAVLEPLLQAARLEAERLHLQEAVAALEKDREVCKPQMLDRYASNALGDLSVYLAGFTTMHAFAMLNKRNLRYESSAN